MCMQLVQKPELYDVIVTVEPVRRHPERPVRRPGRRPGRRSRGATSAPDAAIFEATHGCAPKYKGQNKVNPTALILSGKLMLEHLGENQRRREARTRRRRRHRRRARTSPTT